TLVWTGRSAARASFRSKPSSRLENLRLRGLTALLYVLQPAGRLWGRIRHGLTPWRWRGTLTFVWPRPRPLSLWSGTWQDGAERLQALETAIRSLGAVVKRGSEWERWDLEVRGGLLGGARLLTAVEDHGQGRQLMRVRLWPRYSLVAVGSIVLLATL